MERILLDNDIKYTNKDKILFRSRLELTVSKILSFLSQNYEYDVEIEINNMKFKADFKVGDKYIEVIDSQQDLDRLLKIKELSPNINIVAIGNSRLVAKVKELDALFLIDDKNNSIGSIFIEDPSLSFDYAHILPLVEKCSILHGHTSTVMVEIIGSLKNNLVMDFADAKRIIKESLSLIDHKFFINKKYLKEEDETHYYIRFDGPKGLFDLQIPKITTYLLEGEATVENLSTEIINLLIKRMPSNIEAIGVYIYEGNSKGAHIISKVDRSI